MNITILKLIALFSMLLDHIGAVYGLSGWNIIPIRISEIFRLFGRFSFPIFAFCIANGWTYTKNRENYFLRIIAFTYISQIPYTLAFYPVNTMYINKNTDSFFSNINIYSIFTYIIFTCLCIGFYYIYISNNKNILININIAISLLFSIFILKLNYIWFNADTLNIFYTLILGLMYIYCYEYIKNHHKLYKYIFMIITIISVTIFVGLKADYGNFVLGPILIFSLYITQKYRWIQSFSIICWGFIFYGIIYGNWKSAIAVIPAAIFILFYNNKKGLNKKIFFYLFYPVHLLLIGLINIFIKLI